MRQFAAQERQAEKEKMQEWKDKIMEEMTRQLYSIRQTQEKEIEAQKRYFKIELEEVGGKLEQLELRSKTLENEVRALRLSGQLVAQSSSTMVKELGQTNHTNTNQQRPSSEEPGKSSDCRLTSSSPAVKNTPTIPKAISGIKSAKPAPISYAQVAASNITQSTLNNSWTKVTSGNRKRKGKTASPPKVEPEKKRLIFRKQANSPQKSEADLMLVVNESLQKVGILAYVRFSKVGYSQSGAILGLLTERSNAEDLIKQHSNTLI